MAQGPGPARQQAVSAASRSQSSQHQRRPDAHHAVPQGQPGWRHSAQGGAGLDQQKAALSFPGLLGVRRLGGPTHVASQLV